MVVTFRPAAVETGMPHERTATPFETDVTLPNISCKHCTLQIVQFMEQHGANNPGMYTYHHCAAVQITADNATISRGADGRTQAVLKLDIPLSGGFVPSDGVTTSTHRAPSQCCRPFPGE